VKRRMVMQFRFPAGNITQVLALSPAFMSDVPDAGAFGRNSVQHSAHGAVRSRTLRAGRR